MLSGFKSSVREVLSANGRLFTFFAALTIIVVGITVIDNPANWWVSLVAIAIFCSVIFLFTNARVFIKAVFSIGLVLFETAWAFRLASVGFSDGNATIWATSVILSFLIPLAASYWFPTPAGRWGAVALSSTFGFAISYVVSILTTNVMIGSTTGMVLSWLLFAAMFYFGRRSRFPLKNMPKSGVTEEFSQAVRSSLLPNGWGVADVGRGSLSGLLVWNDKNAFVLTEAYLEQKFGVGSRRKRTFLTYQGKSIDAWLTYLNTTLIPAFGLKGANVLLVLLDVDSRNGEAKTIGVRIPDSNAKLAVGIFPAKSFLKQKNFRKMMEELTTTYQPFLPSLSEKQVAALDKRVDPTQIPSEELTSVVSSQKEDNKKPSVSDSESLKKVSVVEPRRTSESLSEGLTDTSNAPSVRKKESNEQKTLVSSVPLVESARDNSPTHLFSRRRPNRVIQLEEIDPKQVDTLPSERIGKPIRITKTNFSQTDKNLTDDSDKEDTTKDEEIS